MALIIPERKKRKVAGLIIPDRITGEIPQERPKLSSIRLTDTPAISTETTTPQTTQAVGPLGGALNLVKGLGKVALQPKQTAKDVFEASNLIIPSLVSGVERAGARVAEPIGKGVSFVAETLNLPGQIAEAITQGRVKAPELKPVVFSQVSNILEEKADEASDLSKFLQSQEVQVQDDRLFAEKLKDPKFLVKGLTNSFLTFAGAMGVSVAGTIVGGPVVGAGAGLAFAASLEGGLAINDVIDFIENSDKPEIQALKGDKEFQNNVGLAVGITNGMLEMLPITKLLNRSAVGGSIKRKILREITGNIITQMASEGGTEGLQEIVSNAVAKIYDEDRELLQGVAESTLFGSLTGGGVSVSTDVAKAGIKRVRESTPQERQRGFIKVPFGEDGTSKDLAQEAKKFKTAEEFVDSRNLLFRGGSERSTEAIKQGKFFAKEGEPIWFSTTKKGAERYGDNFVEADLSNLKFIEPSEANKLAIKIGLGEKYSFRNPEFIEALVNEGFDGIKMGNGVDFAILNTKVDIKTKSQLTDFFNKAKGEKPEVATQETTKGRKTKQVVKKETQPSSQKITKTESQLLKSQIKGQARTAKIVKGVEQKVTKRQVAVEKRETISRVLLEKKATKRQVAFEKREKGRAVKKTAKETRQNILEKINTEQTSVAQVKQDIVDYANTFLPTEAKGKLLATVKNAKTFNDLNKAKERIAEIGEKSDTKKLRTQIKKELSKIRPKKQAGKPVGKFTPFIQKTLDGIKEAVKLTEEQAEVVIEKNLETPIITPGIALQNKILSIFSGLQEKDSIGLQKILDNITKIKEEGRALNELNKFNIEEELTRKKNLVVDGATGGKGLPKGLQTTGKVEKTFTQKGQTMLKSLGAKWVMGWNGLMGIVDFNAGVDNQKLSRTFSVLDQENEYKLRQNQYVTKFNEAMSSAYGIENKPSAIRKIIIDKNKSVKLGKFTNSVGQEVELEFTTAEMMKMYAEFQDPSLTESFDKGNNLTEKIKTAIESKLSPQDKAFSREALNMWQAQYSEMNPVFSKMNGIDMPQNDNYSPIKRVGFEINTEKGLGEFIEEINYRKAITPSATKSRVKSILPIEKQNIFEVLDHHMTETNYYITWAEKVRELDSVFKDSKVRFAIENNYARKVVSAIDNTINDLATKGNKVARRYPAVDWFRKKFTLGALMIKPALTAKQYVSTVAYYEVLSPSEFASGVIDFWKHPIRNAKILNQESILIRERGANMERDIKDAIKSDVFSRYSKSQNFINTLMLNVKLGDKGAILTGSWAIRKARLAKGASVQDVVAEYEAFSSQTQQSADLSQLSEVQRGGSFEQLFTMFKSSQRQYFAKEMNAIKSLFQKGGTTPKNIKKVAKIMAIYHLMLPMFFQFVSNFGGWDEDDKKEYLRAGILGSLNGLFLFGDIVDSIIRGALGLRVWDLEIPVTTVVDDINRAVSKIDIDDITIEDMGDALFELTRVGNSLGYPVEQVINMGQGIKTLADGDIKNGTGLILGWSPFVLGTTKKKKKVEDRTTTKRSRSRDDSRGSSIKRSRER